MEAVIERQDVPGLVKSPPPSLKHRVCPCQIDAEPGFTRCGLERAGRGKPISAVPPRDICVVCHDLAVSRIPCLFCKHVAA